MRYRYRHKCSRVVCSLFEIGYVRTNLERRVQARNCFALSARDASSSVTATSSAMPFSQPTSLVEYDHQISLQQNAELDLQQAAKLVGLKRQRNALVPICSVPPEVLAAILRFLRRPRKRFGGPILTIKLDEPWAYAMLISTRFREVAVATPALWSTISLAGRKEWVELCLRRAQNHPLSLLSVDSSRCELVSRSRLAEVTSGDPAAFTAAAPHLKILSFLAHGQLREIGPLFLGGTMGSMIRLTLQMVTLLRELPDMARLRRLELSHVMIRDPAAFAQILRGIPNVQDILLCCLIIPEETLSPAGAPPVPLPHLRVLYIEDIIETARLYMQSIPTPSDALGLMLTSWRYPEVLRSECESVYHHWDAFIKSHDLSLERTLLFSGRDDDESLHLTFNRPTKRSRFGARSPSFFSAKLASHVMIEHGLLELVPALHILRDHMPSGEFDTRAADVISCLGHMPNVQLLVLEEFDDVDYEVTAKLEIWIRSNPGRITRIQLLDCYEGMEAFVKRMRDMELIVSWELEDASEHESEGDE
jgi:hypothetical protein